MSKASNRVPGAAWVAAVWVAVLLMVTACAGGEAALHEEPSSSPGAPPVSASPTRGSPATIPLDELKGRILFTRAGGRYGDETIYVANADATDERRISGYGKTCCARWTTDGNIAWPTLTRDKRFTTLIVNPRGRVLKRLPVPSAVSNIGCLPLERRVGRWRYVCEVEADDQRPGGLYLFDGDDEVQQILQTEPGMWNFVMDTSPDGSDLYMCRPHDDPIFDCALWVIGVDGHGVRRVTPADMPADVAGGAGGRLSPDGKLIVFAHNGVVMTIRVDGTDLREIYADPEERIAITPTWSPDGKFILMGLDPPNTNATLSDAPPNGLYVIRSNGEDLTPLVTTKDWKRGPDWTTD